MNHLPPSKCFKEIAANWEMKALCAKTKKATNTFIMNNLCNKLPTAMNCVWWIVVCQMTLLFLLSQGLAETLVPIQILLFLVLVLTATYHTDYVYSVSNGKYIPKLNSQVENTPTLIYSLGSSRTLKWKSRHLSK